MSERNWIYLVITNAFASLFISIFHYIFSDSSSSFPFIFITFQLLPSSTKAATKHTCLGAIPIEYSDLLQTCKGSFYKFLALSFEITYFDYTATLVSQYALLHATLYLISCLTPLLYLSFTTCPSVLVASDLALLSFNVSLKPFLL